MTHAEFRQLHPAAPGLEPTGCIGELAEGGTMVDPDGGHQVMIMVCQAPDCGHVVVWDRTDDRVRNDYHPDPRRLVRELAARMKAPSGQ
jgi:hypothetical protein